MLYCPVISAEVLTLYFQNHSDSPFRTYLARLVHANLVTATPLSLHKKESSTDSRTSVVYVLTQKGFLSVCHYRDLKERDYKSLKSTKYLMHTYCFSYNFLSLLLNPSIETIDYFSTELLLNYGRSGSRNIKDMLFVGMFDMLAETRLYIEQDIGT